MTSLSTNPVEERPSSPATASDRKEGERSSRIDDHSKLNGVAPGTSSNTEASDGLEKSDMPPHGFRMQVNVQKAASRRKRKRDLAGSSGAVAATSGSSPNMSLSISSSSSSSDEEDSEGKRLSRSGEIGEQQDDVGMTRDSSDALHGVSSAEFSHQQHQQKGGSPTNGISQHYESQALQERNKAGSAGSASKHHGQELKSSNLHAQAQTPNNHCHVNDISHPQQSEGWRVKLYRLNADGSWDDCGTGSILCLYKKGGTHQSSPPDPAQNNSSAGEAWIYQELGEPTLCMHSEIKHPTAGITSPPRILLRTRILLRDAYQRQGDNIITWCEPFLEEGNPAQGVDLALSFQDIAGCLDIWRQITQVQSKAAELYRLTGGDKGGNDGNHRPQAGSKHDGGPNGESSRESSKGSRSVKAVAQAVAPAHHVDLQRQQQEEMWVNVASETAQHHLDHQNAMVERSRPHQFEAGSMVAGYNETDSGPQSLSSNTAQSPQLPNPPGLANLEEIADTIAAVQHMQQRESLALFISQNECSYLKSLLSLFPSAESRGDYGSLATLAACIKTILLLNDPSIIELIVTDELIFEEVCSTLEYDPDLRDKANHRWFLRERAKFRTVVLMEDEELVASIHRSFRVNYMRDTLLRPTMDESSLSTLSSLQTFMHADVVKGVTMSPAGTDDKGDLLKNSYLAKVIRILGKELDVICAKEWQEIEALPPDGDLHTLLAAQAEELANDTSKLVVTGKYPQSEKMSRVWKQYLAPQDGSLASRRMRRRGCLTFLRELFNMVRISLQQSDKDDFFAVLVSMEVDLDYEIESTASKNPYLDSSVEGTTDSSQSEDPDVENKSTNPTQIGDEEPRSVNLLSLLGTVLADPSIDVTEKGSVLEIISGIAMHDPSLIRRRCLDTYTCWKRKRSPAAKYIDSLGPIRPFPNEKRQVIFHCPPNDLLGSLLFLLATETDAGVLLQVSEIMRIVLDTDMMADHGPMGGGFADEAEGIPSGGIHLSPYEQHVNRSGSLTTSTDQNKFLSMFYEHYVQWLAAPFQYKMLQPIRRIPRKILEKEGYSDRVQLMIENFEKGHTDKEILLCYVAKNAIRASFAVELLSFCVRAHLYRMKCYLLRSKVLGNVLKVLWPSRNSSGERCLTLAALRFLRSILSVNDEFYHRHITQNNLFAPVFAAFRANPVGDNLVSSAIVEMCDFIHTENIKSLVEHIVTKHLSATSETSIPSLEDVSSPYVSTLTVLRKTYEKNLKADNRAPANETKDEELPGNNIALAGFFHGNGPARNSTLALNEKAREDQRKFREVDQEESYFDSDDDDGPHPTTVLPPAVDEVEAQDADIEMHRAPRMFSLAQAPLLSSETLRRDDQNLPIVHSGSGPPVEKNGDGVTSAQRINGNLIK